MSPLDKAIKVEFEKLVSPAHLLARIYRRILLEGGFTNERLEELLSIYSVAPGMTRKQETDSRGKLRARLAAAVLTYKTFITGVRMLRPRRVVFGVRVEFYDRDPVQIEEQLLFTDQPLEPAEPTIH